MGSMAQQRQGDHPPLLVLLLAEQRRRRLEEHQRAARLSVPQAPPSDAVKSRVREAERAWQKAQFLRAASKRPRGKTLAAIKDHEAYAKRLLREARDLAQADVDAAWLERALTESVNLALARGELVGDQPIAGSKAKRKIMLSRGLGLEHARDNGYLTGAHGRDETDDLYRAGVAYREAYEVIDGLAGRRGEGGGGFGPKGPQVRQAEAGQALAIMRGAMSDRQRRVVDAVCGKGLGMFEAAKDAGVGVPASRNALRGGLGAALKALRAARKGGRGVGLAERLNAAHGAVARAGRGL